MGAIARAWKWILALVAVIPVTGWALLGWRREKHRRAQAEKALDDSLAARVQAEKERADIHEAYHRDSVKIARVRAELEALEPDKVAAAWDHAFGDHPRGGSQ